MTFVFYVRGQALSGFVPDVVVSDTINYQNAEVHFSEDWDGLDKWLHLKSPDGVEYEARLVDDRVENLNLSAGRWEVWFHGSRPGEDGTDDLRITTDTTAFVVEQSGSLDGDPLPPIELTAAEQIAAAVTRAETEVAELREDVEQYKQDVDETAQAVQAAKVAAEAAAVGAFGSQAAADQSAQAAHVSEQNAEKAKKAIEDMSVQTITLDTGADSTVTKEMVGDAVRLIFGIARGERGPEGPEGPVGASVERIERTSGTGAPGETDTYTGYLSNGETFSFSVYNGKDGKDGKDGSGTGDMATEVYDPQGLARDVFAYAEAQVEEHAGDTNNPHGVTAEQVGAVKKSGDTMTGKLTITSPSYCDQLIINRTGTSNGDSCIGYHKDGVKVGVMGFRYDGTPFLQRKDDADNVALEILHTGNISTYAAPAGFGLGSASTDKIITSKAELDAIRVNGWCYYNGAEPLVVEANVQRATIRTDTSGRTITQTAYPFLSTLYENCTLQRTLLDTIASTEWGAWEWVNPPMILGWEYRTTERIDGKAVYKKNDNGVIKYRLDGETEWRQYAEVVGAAPAGFGLGGNAKTLTASDDLNNITAGGWYTWDELPVNSTNYMANGQMLVLNGAWGLVTQVVYGTKGSVVQRSCYYGTWQPWERRDPPMELGVEYRTTERITDKAVYKRNNGGTIEYRLDGETEWKPYLNANGNAPASHTHAASAITEGQFSGRVRANGTSVTNVGTAQLRDIYAGTSDLTAGTSGLVSGVVYLVYE